MAVRAAVDQHSFHWSSIQRGDDDKPVEITYYTRFADVFADIEDVQVGDPATVMYLESPTVADGIITEIRPDNPERPDMGGLIYIKTDLTTCRDD